MKPHLFRGRAIRRSIRGQVLAIVLVPCLVLLGTGIAAAAYLFQSGTKAEAFAQDLSGASKLLVTFSTAAEEERRLSLLKIAGDQQAAAALDAQRLQVDAERTAVLAVQQSQISLDPQAMSGSDSAAVMNLGTQLATVRRQIDLGQISLDDAYAYYAAFLAPTSAGTWFLAQYAPNAQVAAAEFTDADLIQVVETMSKGHALGLAAVLAGGLSRSEYNEYAKQVGGYHAQLDYVLGRLSGTERTQYDQLVASTAWRQLTTMENSLLARGPRTSGPQQTSTLPLSVPAWQADIRQVSDGLLGLVEAQHLAAGLLAADAGHSSAVQSVWLGVAVLLVTVAALLVALWLSNRLVRRMKRLRAETLDMAHEQLPRLVARLRDGADVDIDRDVPTLDHGKDELGEVADAFNQAQHTAVAAAIAEARTREGVNAVFLNLAHRSQVVVHRQLEVLDKAEYNQEDPEQLELLFQLDHLATRARRNAENLVILGGEQPRRQWRNPVALSEIVRAAAAESEEYARIRIARLPDEFVIGTGVADLIHLLAELLDNATNFSPPDSRVDVSGNRAGRGMIVEITDQGLGIPEEDLVRINAALREPPDFSAMQLSSDSRLGLFVVGQLATRHGISVRLAESDYCGIRVIIMIPSALLFGDQQGVRPPEDVAANGSHLPGARRNRRRLPAQRAGSDLANTPAWPTEEPTAEPNGAHAPAAVRQHVPVAIRAPLRQQRSSAPPPTEGRPQLPRRQRLANLAPQLARADAMAQHRAVDDEEPPASAEHSRDLMSAIQTATRRARHARDTEPAGHSGGPARAE